MSDKELTPSIRELKKKKINPDLQAFTATATAFPIAQYFPEKLFEGWLQVIIPSEHAQVC